LAPPSARPQPTHFSSPPHSDKKKARVVARKELNLNNFPLFSSGSSEHFKELFVARETPEKFVSTATHASFFRFPALFSFAFEK
jgi:hypothetical protein